MDKFKSNVPQLKSWFLVMLDKIYLLFPMKCIFEITLFQRCLIKHGELIHVKVAEDGKALLFEQDQPVTS